MNVTFWRNFTLFFGGLSAICFVALGLDKVTGFISQTTWFPTFWHFCAYVGMIIAGVAMLVWRDHIHMPQLPPFRFVGPQPKYRRGYASQTKRDKYASYRRVQP